MPTTQPSARRRFQVSMREIALAVMALGFAMAWLSERQASLPLRSGIEYLQSVPATSIYGQSVGIECECQGMPVDVVISRRAATPGGRVPIGADWAVHWLAPQTARQPQP